ncbi:ATP-grasp domain-containing protein [Micromonospora pallida]|uniref:ATP-grasp domain-containing protein n=1 Tax=Micromonospora pallida TaxID=145854 RepID=A0A1C6S8H4_9ACTN|nr:ATP-grasp domain-containing protein [Micromonospora pallida]SCL25776.1 ATP-grasp domain-containing protein [Micromonospora pallida]
MAGPLVVVFDRGAASAAEIAVGLGALGPVTFLVNPSEHTRRTGDVLRRLGDVVPLTGDRAADLAALRRLTPAGVLTFSEPMLPATAWLADALGLPFHSIATTELLTNKARQRERLRRHGVDDVRSRPISSIDEWAAAREHVGLPAVVKPVHGQGSRNTYVITDDAAAHRVLVPLLPAGRASTVIVEELLVGRSGGPYGDYVSVESYHGPQGLRHLAVTGKLPLAPPFRETGQFWPAAVSDVERQEILDLATRVLTALDLGPGLTHTEIKLTDRGPRIIEVNGRLGGHINALARHCAGFDTVQLAGRLALGQPVTVPALDQPSRVYFQCHTLAPVEPCELLSVTGAAEVRRMDGIDGFRAYARVGDGFEADVMTRHLDLLWGHCDGHADLAALLDDAQRRICYEFRFGDGKRRLSAADLRRGC